MSTMQMRSPAKFLAPVPPPIKGTLLDVAQVTPDYPNQHDALALFESYNCIDTDTLATMPCPATFLAAPVQTAAGTATTGGTLAAGTYRAVITAINSRGETVKSNEISRVTTGSASTITWNWNAVTGATGYRVYVTAVGGAAASETYLVEVGAVTTYVWTGTPAQAPTNPAPPTINTATVNATKTFGASPSWQDGLAFAAYVGFKCKAIALDPERARAEVERVFNNKESQAVARFLMVNRFVDGGTLNWDAATDITPVAGAVDPDVGLALLEGHAGANYGGQPLIHAPRTIGSLLTRNGQAKLDGNRLVSSLDTPIAADPGYEFPNNGPSGAAPSAGELWMYASGQVTVAAGNAIDKGSDLHVGLRVNESADSNNVYMLRERPYIVTADCYTAAVRVKVE